MAKYWVLDDEKSIKQLRYSEDKFHLVDQFSFDLENIDNMCYYERYGIVIVLHRDWRTLTGIMLATGQVVWKHTEVQYRNPPNVSDPVTLDYFQDVLTIPDGRICVLNLWKLFVLDAKDGTIRYELLDVTGSGSIWKIATRTNGFQQKIGSS